MLFVEISTVYFKQCRNIDKAIIDILFSHACIFNCINISEKEKALKPPQHNKTEKSAELWKDIKTLLAYSHVTVFIQDRQLRYKWIHNPVKGLSVEGVLNKKDEDLFPTEQAAQLTILKQEVLNSGVSKKTVIDLSGGDYELFIEPVYSETGDVDNIVCVALNKTSSQSSEDIIIDALNRAKNELPDRSHNLEAITKQILTNSFNKQDFQKEDLSRAANETAQLASIGVLASGITHEIKQPLNSMRIFGESILYWNTENDNVLPEVVVENVNNIIRSIDRMNEIVDHMRSFWNSSIEPKRDKIDFNQRVMASLGMMKSKINAHGIRLELDLAEKLPVLHGDRIQVEQIVTNLVTNAVNALDTIQQTEKWIRVKTYVKSEQIFLEILDNGPGIEKKDMDDLFNPLNIHKANLKNGMGLGLAIVDMFVKKMNGSITVQSNTPAGARFILSFPKLEGNSKP